uniref:Uncharacterized protein n=1 Tax=Arundo donax TaxID=35708 RepID=A0A0A9ALE0_ARUDO
MGNKGEISS